MVERLTYAQAVKQWDKASEDVLSAEEDLLRAHRALRLATAEMHYALHERLKEPLP
jgi:hypothetical protein